MLVAALYFPKKKSVPKFNTEAKYISSKIWKESRMYLGQGLNINL